MRGAPSSPGLRAELETALGHHRAGRIKDAKRIYEKLLRLYPGHTDIMHFLGVAALDEGDPKHAVRMISRAVARSPANPSAQNNLGNALRAEGRLVEAASSYEAAIRLSPQFAEAHCNMGVLRNDQGQTEQAIQSFKRAIGLDPRLHDAHVGLAHAYSAAGQFAAEKAALRHALALRPDDKATLNSLVVAEARSGASAQSLALIASILQDQPVSLEALNSCARAYYAMARYEDAARLYARAVKIADAPAETWNELGRTERVLGKLEKAAHCFRQAMALDPGSWDARRNLALISQADAASLTNLPDHRPNGGASAWDQVLSGFTLGEILDRQGDYDAAFAEYSKANARLKDLQAARGLRFDAEAQRRRVDAILSKSAVPPSPVGSSSELPVFIVGMPRSGTSLVEQVLASHSSVFGAGERKALLALSNVFEAGSLQTGDIERYLAAWLDGRPGVLRATDKMPDNVFLLNGVAQLLPNARIIYCDRNPYDLVLSCYFQLFQDGNVFSTDLLDSSIQAIQISRLKRHWQSILGSRFISVNYETMVADLEGESRRLIEFLGLPWEPACLDFHRTQRPVATASGWQVRQPLYATSVGRWRNYRRHLNRVEQELSSADPGWILPGPDLLRAGAPSVVVAGRDVSGPGGSPSTWRDAGE